MPKIRKVHLSSDNTIIKNRVMLPKVPLCMPWKTSSRTHILSTSKDKVTCQRCLIVLIKKEEELCLSFKRLSDKASAEQRRLSDRLHTMRFYKTLSGID